MMVERANAFSRIADVIVDVDARSTDDIVREIVTVMKGPPPGGGGGPGREGEDV
jgi:hypothetical protein